MAMTPTLHTISGLAVELGRDRRTIAKIVQNVPPAGKRGGHDAWLLRDVVDEIERQNAARVVRESEGALDDPMLGNLAHRLECFEEIKFDPKSETMTVPAMASLFGIDEDLILHWLRAGAPYTKRGDFKTGRGFRICIAHLYDWMMLLQPALVIAEQNGVRAPDGRSYRACLRMDFEGV
jgi:hypothetical protein